MRRPSIRLFGLGIVATFVLFPAVEGCSRSDRVSVTGVVRYADGTPVPRGVVRFEGKTRCGFAAIQSDGRYTISGGGAGPGIVPGVYTVVIDNSAEPPAWDEGRKTYVYGKPAVDPRYTSTESSPLSCTVASSMRFDIVVDRPRE